MRLFLRAALCALTIIISVPEAGAQTTPCDWVEVSTGQGHTLAIRRDGTLWSWGLNSLGQLGIGNFTSSTRPRQVGTAANWTKVAAADLYSFAINSNGELWAWGTNTYGELGIGSTVSQLSPVRVGTATNWASVCGGYGNSLGVRANGTLWSWGFNQFGELGLGNTVNRTAPVQVGVLNNWAEAAAGFLFSLARRTDGTVWSTGENSSGQLGLNSTTSRNTFAQIISLSGVTQITAGYDHGIAMLNTGALRSWGSNTYGQLGDATTTTRLAPVAVSGITTAARIEAHTYFSVCMLPDGTIRSWGRNDAGQLGDGTTTNRTTGVAAAGIASAFKISSGGLAPVHTIHLLQNGQYLAATGANTDGNFGNGTTAGSLTPSTRRAVIGPAGICQGTQFWYDAGNPSNTGTGAANNAPIATWRDVSNNLNDATVLAPQGTPVINTNQINGKEVMHFTRTSQTAGTVYNVANVDIRASVMPQTTSFTVYRQGAKVNTVAEQHGIWGDDNGGWDRFFMSSYFSDNGLVAVGPTTDFVPVPNAGTPGQVRLLTSVYDKGVPNGSTIYFNAAPVATVTDNTDNTAAQTTVRIGFDGDDNCFNGDIAEMIWYNRKLTQCEILQVNKYLGFKYGVTFTSATIIPAPVVNSCAGSVPLTASAGAAWEWLFNGATIGGAASQIYNAGTTGNYQVVITYAGGCKDTSLITRVNIVTPVMYVDGSVAASGSGASWASPYKTITEALDVANAVTCASEIWVKKGTYYPMANATTVATSRDSSFRIRRDYIRLYGGFAGTETDPSQRVIAANPTILSGDINIPNSVTDNSYHVMTIASNGTRNITPNTVVDGFTVTGGKADGGAVAGVYGVNIAQYTGGGILNLATGATAVCNPTLRNINFIGNSAQYGGGLFAEGFASGKCDVSVSDSRFSNNSATFEGGAARFTAGGAGGTSNTDIQTCVFENNTSGARGAGVFVSAGLPAVANVTIANTNFTGNTAPLATAGQYGGAVCLVNTGVNASIAGCAFTGNMAAYAGAVMGLDVQTLSLQNSSFTGNFTSITGNVYVQNAPLTAGNLNFLRNKAGAGAAIALTGTAAITMTASTIAFDTATFYGSALYNISSAVQTINNCRFSNNHSGAVGVIDNAGSGTLNVRESVFESNTSDDMGAVTNNFSGTGNYRNCVFVNNTARGSTGGGIAHIQANSTLNLFDCTGYNNTTGSTSLPNANSFAIDANATVNINNSILWGAAAIQVAGGGTVNTAFSNVRGISGGSNINIDPLFVDATDPDGIDNVWRTADDGLHLRNCSPSINTGSNGLIPAGTNFDVAGDARIQQSIVDMGAYEQLYVAPPTQTVSIAITAGNQTICAGQSVTFTATSTNGGANPVYQWQVNGVNAGTNSPTFTSTTLANNDAVTVLFTGGLQCVLPAPTITSNSISITVNPSVTPGVSIMITNGSQNICPGASVTFTATPTNGGAVPSYQWQVNGVNAGTNSPTFTSSSLNNNETVTVVLTSNATCAVPPMATSNGIVITVSPNVTPSVSIAITTGSQMICAGTSVTFTATPANGGATPSYQWQVNGVNSGTNSATFTSSTLGNNDAVTVILTSNANCLTTNNVVSNSIMMTVNPNLTPSVSIAVTTGSSTICSGTSVTFTATPVNGGATPAFQWQVNGINAGTNSPVFTSTTLATGDVVRVLLTSSETCVTINNVSSNTITMTVNPNLTPTVSIAITNGSQTICAGTSVTFTATGTNGGSAPSYQWQVNGANAGTNSSTFTSSTLNNNDAVRVVFTSNETCLATNNVQSNAISMTVNPTLTPSATIAITTGSQTICAGSVVTFMATPVNGGTSPGYQWLINGGSQGFNSATFTTTALANGDVVSMILTSSETCLTANNVSSNTITMAVNPNLTPAVTITAPKTTVCDNEPLLFTATAVHGGATPAYQWKKNGVNVGTNSPLYNAFPIIAGDVVTVQLTSSEICVTAASATSNSITLDVADNPVLTLNPPKEILEGGVAQLTSTSTEPVATYTWSPAIGLSSTSIPNPVAAPITGTTYRLNVISSAGCAGTASVKITVIARPRIANTFTPNGDGIHDVWEIKGLESYPNSRVQVFTRSGQLVYETKGYAKPWNGTMNGKLLPSDTYYYIMEWNNLIKSAPITGFVTIMR